MSNQPTTIERLQRLLDEQASKADLAAFNEALMDHFHGPKGLAAAVYREYEDAEKGSVARQRLLTATLDVYQKVAEMQDKESLLDEMSDEELEPVVLKLLQDRGLSEPATERGGGDERGAQ